MDIRTPSSFVAPSIRGVILETEPQEEKKSGLFSRLKKGLSKTRQSLAGGLDNVVHGHAAVGPQMMEELEEALLIADMGISATRKILESLENGVRAERIRTREGVLEHLKEQMAALLDRSRSSLDLAAHSPFVILMIGVNGSGKTTTIGKLSQKWREEGRRVLLAAADTFRAAAIGQLQSWADRTGADFIHQAPGSDPSAVAYDAVQAAAAGKADVVLVDTAGRLQTNVNLMEELKKIKRVIGKCQAGAPHATWLVLDAGTGQNSISQAKLFHDALGVDGLILTKLDGSAKGGVLFQITGTLGLPVCFVGVGEKPEDLQEFDPGLFVDALLQP